MLFEQFLCIGSRFLDGIYYSKISDQLLIWEAKEVVGIIGVIRFELLQMMDCSEVLYDMFSWVGLSTCLPKLLGNLEE
jgi:hypothetical protein